MSMSRVHMSSASIEQLHKIVHYQQCANLAVGKVKASDDYRPQQDNAEVAAAGHIVVTSPIKTSENIIAHVSIVKCLQCDACQAEDTPGFKWGEENEICINCIRDMCIHHKAKESWAEKNGDPMSKLLKRIRHLEDRLESLEKLEISRPNEEKTDK